MLQLNKTAIVLIDVQGKLADQMQQKDKLFSNINILLEAANILDIPIIWLEQLPEKLGATRAEITAQLSSHTAINKCTFSGYQNSEFEQVIKDSDRTQFLLAGIEAHICVFQTAMDLLQQGRQVHIISDAVSSRSKQNKKIALNRLQQNGAVLSAVEMALFELMRTTEHDKFREIIKLIK